MKCRHAKKMISRYIDDELARDEKKDFSSHIRVCSLCREVLEETRALHELFAAAGQFPAPHGFAARVMANLERREESRRRRFPGFRPLFFRTAQVAFALVVMTIGAISGSLLLPERPERTDPIVQTAVQDNFSLDLFQATPPGSIGGVYNTLMESLHEK